MIYSGILADLSGRPDPGAFFTSESDRGPGHAPGHGLAVPRQVPYAAPCPGQGMTRSEM